MDTTIYEKNVTPSVPTTPINPGKSKTSNIPTTPVKPDKPTISNVTPKTNRSKTVPTSVKRRQLTKSSASYLNNSKTLPQTGEQTNSNLSVYGTILVALSGILGLLGLGHKRKND